MSLQLPLFDQLHPVLEVRLQILGVPAVDGSVEAQTACEMVQACFLQRSVCLVVCGTAGRGMNGLEYKLIF